MVVVVVASAVAAVAIAGSPVAERGDGLVRPPLFRPPLFRAAIQHRSTSLIVTMRPMRGFLTSGKVRESSRVP